MKNWMKNGLVVLLAASILAAGFFGMDIIKTVLPSYQGTITQAASAGDTAPLYVDAQEELVFYPWTTFREEETLFLIEQIQAAEGQYDEQMIAKELKEFNSLFHDACSFLNTDFTPQTGEDFASHLLYQPSVQKHFLMQQEYSAVNGDTLYLDLVWDGMGIEALHITKDDKPTSLSNDKRLQCTQRLEKSIQNNRLVQTQRNYVYKQTPRTGSYKDSYIEDGLEYNMPVSQEPLLLDQFLQYYLNINRPIYYDVYETLLPRLLYEGAYHFVFYEGEILLFFLPDTSIVSLTKEDTTGLLLYIDPQDNTITGFNILNLAV